MHAPATRPVFAYGVAVLAVAAAVLFRWLLDPWLGEHWATVTVCGAVAAAVWYGGYRPALVATILGYLACNYLFMEHRGFIGLKQPSSSIGLALYLFTCSLIIGFGEAMRAARRRTEVGQQELAFKHRQLEKETAIRQQAAEASRQSENRLAAELDAMTCLHALSTRLVAATDLPTALEDVLESALQTCRADFGNIQLFNPQAAALEIVAQRGFRQDFLDYFRMVRVDDGSACARALQSGERIIIEDVELDPSFEPHRGIAAAAGFRGVQSTPLKGRSGTVLGMLSTHCRQPHRPSEHGRRLLDLYARHAADLVERLRADEQLRVVREQLQLVTDVMSAPVTRCSRDLRYLWVSKPYADWLGRTPAEIVGQPIRDVIGSAAFEHLRPRFEQVLSGRKVRYEEEVDFQGAGRRWINAVYTPTVDAAGVPDGWVAVVLDVTERKREELGLQEADRRKDEFLATLAHELRNPLAPIRNAVELLRRADGQADLREQARGLLERQLGVMVRLVDDLLDVSRITKGRLQLRKERAELAAVVRSAVEAACPPIEARAHELTVTLPPQPVYLDADPIRLAQVFLNLLTNAAKYTEKGGHIWLTAETQGGEVAVSVRDTGIGIAAEHLPGLFAMFCQVAPALERSQGGLGIGLSLVKGLVELHGGSVEARSGGPGMGSEFLVRLPVAAAPVEAPPQQSGDGDGTGSGSPSRILVVDDNRDAAVSLAMMLRLMGHDTQTAHDGLEAVQAAATIRPDVVLLDLGMPRMNGYEAARHIREQPWGGNMALIALTGWGQEEDKRRSLEAGFDHHLTKPVDPAALEKLLAVMSPVRQP